MNRVIVVWFRGEPLMMNPFFGLKFILVLLYSITTTTVLLFETKV